MFHDIGLTGQAQLLNAIAIRHLGSMRMIVSSVIVVGSLDELLDALCKDVSHVNGTIVSDGDVMSHQRSIPADRRRKATDQGAFRIKLYDDAAVLPTGLNDEHIAIGGDVNAIGSAELATFPLVDKSTVLVEDFDPGIAPVDDKYLIVSIHGQAMRKIELATAFAGFAPFGQERTVRPILDQPCIVITI